MVEILTNGPTLCASPQLLVQWDHTGSWKSAMMGEFTPWELVNATNQDFWFFLILYYLENNGEEVTNAH